MRISDSEKALPRRSASSSTHRKNFFKKFFRTLTRHFAIVSTLLRSSWHALCNEDLTRAHREFQQARKDSHMADAAKNKKAWQQKATDAAGRDWTKPRRPQLKDGEV